MELTNIFIYCINLIGKTGYLGFFLLMIIESTSIPIILPSEIVLIAVGSFVKMGKFNFFISFFVCVSGAVIGAFFNYALGYFLGKKVIYKYGKYIFLNPKKIEQFETTFNKYAGLFTFIGRMLPFIKHICSIPPGLSRMNPIKFGLYTAAGSSILIMLFMFLGTKIGENINKLETISPYINYGILIFTSFIVISYILYHKITKEKK